MIDQLLGWTFNEWAWVLGVTNEKPATLEEALKVQHEWKSQKRELPDQPCIFLNGKDPIRNFEAAKFLFVKVITEHARNLKTI